VKGRQDCGSLINVWIGVKNDSQYFAYSMVLCVENSIVTRPAALNVGEGNDWMESGKGDDELRLAWTRAGFGSDYFIGWIDVVKYNQFQYFLKLR
jgi:hypothetical protein